MGLVCRVVEEAGIATVCLSTGRDLTVQVNPPRSLFVNFPMGNNFGRASDINTQTQILRCALKMIHEVEEAGTLIDWPEQWPEPFGFFSGEKRQAS